MAQDMEKGRRTEIQFMNGYIADKGRQVGIPTPAHVRLTEVVTRVERGEMPQSPQNLP
jgi:2-dehydropantoate 2-reductase